MRPWLLLLAIACKGDPEPATPPTPPEPGDLMVGTARVRMPIPVGIGTVGYGGFLTGGESSPFAELYPATQAIHNHPDFRAIAISRGDTFEAILLRTDTVGTFQQLRQAVITELEARIGRNLDDALVIGSTHTHSGPGRVIDAGGPFDLIADRFFPEHYERTVDAMADTVELALADMKPGRIGYALADAPDGINDRRCEDGLDYVNSTLPMIAVEQEGELVGLHLAYAIHGTVLGIDQLTLSQDVSGGIEQAVQDRFDHPVHVQMFNSWGADMSPANPDVDLREGAEQDSGFDQMERVGIVVADAVEEAMSRLTWTDTPDIAVRTWRVPIDRETIGYDDATFDFDNGAVYCSIAESELTCTGTEHFDDLDDACIPFTDEHPAPNQTELSAGRIGDLYFITFPGEPGTLLAESVMDGIRDANPEVTDIAFFGYSQDYLGYSILEEDWWNGGYESSGALWGPRQGSYLAERAVEVFSWSFGASPPSGLPAPTEPFVPGDYTPYVTAPADAVGTILTDVEASVGASDTVVFEVAGDDPWLGAPLAFLETGDGTPVTRPGGQPIDSDGHAFTVRLIVEPPWDEAASSRTFRWRYELPVQHRQDVGLPTLSGNHQIRVSIPVQDGTLASVTSSPFNVGDL